MTKILLAATLAVGLAHAATAGGLTKADWDYMVQLGYANDSYAVKTINGRPDAAKVWDVVHQKINASYPSADAKATAVNQCMFMYAFDTMLEHGKR